MPTLALVGVPDRRPVLALNVAQLGRFVMLYVSGLPSGSVAFGVKAYCDADRCAVGGVPRDGREAELVGGGVVPTGPKVTFENTAVARDPVAVARHGEARVDARTHRDRDAAALLSPSVAVGRDVRREDVADPTQREPSMARA